MTPDVLVVALPASSRRQRHFTKDLTMSRMFTRTSARSTAAIAALVAVIASTAGCSSESNPSKSEDTPRVSSTTSTSGTSGSSSTTASAGTLSVADAWAKAADTGMSAAFGTLKNDTAQDVTITKVTSDLGVTQLHVMKKTANGPVMTQTDKFVIPAHGSLELKPGSNHIMFMGLNKKLVAGDTVSVTLSGSNGFTQKLTFPVRAYDGAKENYQPSGSASGMSHSGMSSSGMAHSGMTSTTTSHNSGH